MRAEHDGITTFMTDEKLPSDNLQTMGLALGVLRCQPLGSQALFFLR
jgi:hypothetical protein